jgi:hypothetical protein
MQILLNFILQKDINHVMDIYFAIFILIIYFHFHFIFMIFIIIICYQ